MSLIVIDGIDGTGKSTQFRLLCERLRKENVPFRSQNFPRYDKDSSLLLRQYLAGNFGKSVSDVSAYTASVFFAVDRAAAFLEGLSDYCDNGGLLLCDRYTTSNAVHQASKLPKAERAAFAEWLFDFEYNKLGLPEPTRVFLLDMPAALSRELVKRRGAEEDIHEQDAAYLERSAEAAREIAEKFGWYVISCAKEGQLRTPEEISDEIWSAVFALTNRTERT